MPEAQQFWEDLYGARDRVWSGRVNPWLAEVADGLPPGRALDLGCGEGGDSIWLAQRGWDVVAVDISRTALQRAEDNARAAELSGRIDFQWHDLTQTFPDGPFDLISAQFLQSPLEFDRNALLRRATTAVAPGGLLLVVDHGAAPPWAHEMAHKHRFLTVDEVIDPLELDPQGWQRVRAEAVFRDATGPDGEAATVLDNLIVLRRAPSDREGARHAAS